MDRKVTVNVMMTVLVSDERDDPHRVAEELVRQVIGSASNPEHDWAGKFAIIPTDQLVVVNALQASD